MGKYRKVFSFLNFKKTISVFSFLSLGFLAIISSVYFNKINFDNRSKASEIKTVGGIKKIDTFDDLSFNKNSVDFSLYQPPLEGLYSLKVTFIKGNEFSFISKPLPLIDAAGKYLHIDVFPYDITLNWPSSPTIKLLSDGQVVLEERLPVRVGEWNGLNFDLSSKDPLLLSKITEATIYLADVINPGTAKFLLDNLYVSDSPLPVIQKPITIIILALRPEELGNYVNLKTKNTNFAFRTFSPDYKDSNLTKWDRNNVNYFFTAASSDFQANQDIYTR